MHARLLAFASFVALMAMPSWAQFDSQPATSSSGTGTGTTATPIAGGLDAASAFSNVERTGAIGESGDSGKGFSVVGTSTSSSRSSLGGGMAGGMGGLGGFSSLFGIGNATGGGASKPVIRTRLRSAVQFQPSSPALVQQIANLRMQTLPSTSRMPGVNVRVDGQTAILGGTVRSERDRRMSELLLRLEPGVRNVENRIQISP
ncbi:BON domain-containing protein [Novipirellula artificiosorum]|uniref:BON domain protein n=1 Tax=Novipirellula artificiosorum TaxID=2528016 RepID=A0A5C6E2T6_9BACT|nr:BON domain-containing protein [Novipirellula artificiosorum]TWU42814.1 BON domain protein [Novipirellula artificiosorum]